MMIKPTIKSYMIANTPLLLALVLFPVTTLSIRSEESDFPDAETQRILNNWEVSDPLAINRPDLKEIKDRIKNLSVPSHVGLSYDYRARVLLIRAGDLQLAQRTIEEFESGPFSQYGSLGYRCLINIGRPDLIPLVANDLFISEPVDYVFVGDVMSRPRSVLTMSVIRKIVSSNSRFNTKVKSWEKAIKQRSIQEQRDLFKQWWLENRQLIIDGRYEDAQPVLNSPTSA